MFEIDENAPLPLALLWLILGTTLAIGGVLISFLNPTLLPLGILPAIAGGFILPHGFVPLLWAAFRLLVKGVDRALSFALEP